ncbi:MAG: 4'-phosphopantetheinyl transferase superfamily protein [Bacteroidia bacterium]|nr:4'-phosphopantetheinyl transferase superfamily protein [Bacteroidia bacterium]MBT8277485.1 4'-phosphopantetheinyl transferase superfamily protein [Bacteroidia bacterium]NND25251.1 4'-phosphopantetheinyl transferase superfamily protein [Flavobacteriaceae bacterium]NNK61104.1 4'-phosphopantetheinyl transferase superfamily protein [Flavobacteriaceae bacterium]
MPLYKTLHPNSQTHVKIWKISESFSELEQDIELTEDSQYRVEHMKSDIHRRGFLSVRHLLKAFNYTDEDLYYDEFGKPHLKDGKFISITHSFIFSAVIISESSVGIDIEKQREKIQLISKKFIDYEFQYLDKDSDELVCKLTVIWCIKESLYKQFATPGLSFKQHTLVIPFNLHDEQTVSWIDYKGIKKRYTANFFEFEGFTCAYVLPE